MRSHATVCNGEGGGPLVAEAAGNRQWFHARSPQSCTIEGGRSARLGYSGVHAGHGGFLQQYKSCVASQRDRRSRGLGSGSEGRVGVEPYTGSRSSAGNTANGESLVSESKVEGGEGAMSHQKKRERGGTTCKPRTNLSNQPGISDLCSFTLRVGLCETATPGISNSEYEPQPTNLHDPK